MLNKLLPKTFDIANSGAPIRIAAKEAANSGKEVQQCYEEDIMPVKGALEVWYHQNISFLTDIKIILLTAIAIIKPDNTLHTKWFKSMPAGHGCPDEAS